VRGPALVALGVAVLGVVAGCPARMPKAARAPLFADDTAGGAPPGPTALAAPSVAEPAPGPNARTVADGIVVETLVAGSGDPPRPNDRITLRARRWSPDGVELDAAPEQTYEMRRLHFGLAQAVATMRVGERARAWVPAVTTKDAAAQPIVVDLQLRAVQVAPPVPDDVAAPPAAAVALPNGVATVVLERGDGPRPGPADEVVVAYTAWQADGVMLETTTWDGVPTRTWTVNRFNAGLAAGLGEMTAGERRRMWIPIKLTEWAYEADPDAPERICYDVELAAVHVRPPPPKTPKDVRKPPATAKRTAKGVRYRFLARGKARTPRPTATSTVTVHYAGWTTDGRLFDSSISRGSPATFGLGHVIAGWTDVLQVMAPGDKLRAWIPKELAYGDRPGMPQGMLVFDIELLEVR
jgi:peptidylprolyl isomerase